MDKMIVIPINLFNFSQEILIVDENGTHTFTRAELPVLPELINEASQVYSIENIKLIGNGNYAEALANEIKEYAIQNYSNKELNISIMEA
jgi:hypothetical protein